MGNTDLLQEEAGQLVRERVERVVPIPDETAVDGDGQGGEAYLVVCTSEGREHPSFQRLGSQTLFVHIAGAPLLWAIKLTLDRAPNLEILQVRPSSMYLFGPAHIQLCAKRGVHVVEGYVKSEIARMKAAIPPPSFYDHRKFFLNLQRGEQRALRELIKLGIQDVLLVKRYLCLGGEDYAPQHRIAREFGLKEYDSSVSVKVNGVRHYLDSTFPTGEVSKGVARRIRRFVQRERLAKRRKNAANRLLRRLGVSSIPEGIPPSRFYIYRGLLVASRDGRLAILKRKHPRSWFAITFGFGLQDGKYHGQEEVAEEMDIMRQSAVELQRRAIEKLGGVSRSWN